MSTKSVLLATRPLCPPWDEASKNFAYFLGREVQNHNLTLLTTKEILEGVPNTVKQEAIFSERHFNLRTKIELFLHLRKMRASYDVTHYIFTPAKQNVRAIKSFALPTKGKTLQTVATLRDDLYSPQELRSLLFADHLVVYTDLSKEKLSRLGFHNVTRIYPGIDLTRYAPREKNPDILKQFGFEASSFVVIYPGEYVRLGATDMLTDALVDFFTKNPTTDIRFVFACRVKNEGDAKKKSEVQKRFIDARLEKYIDFSDTISDMPALYNTADVVAFPVGNLEGKFDVPLIIIEAYACGKPVILSDLPAFSEFANERICVTIPKDSGEEFIRSMAYLRENNEKRISYGENARAFVEEHFDLKNTALQYEEIYSSL